MLVLLNNISIALFVTYITCVDPEGPFHKQKNHFLLVLQDNLMRSPFLTILPSSGSFETILIAFDTVKNLVAYHSIKDVALLFIIFT